MFKKPVAIMAALALSISLASSAFAAFENFHLIRVVSDSSSTKEVATDLGDITTLATLSNTVVGGGADAFTNFNSNPFDNLSINYYAVNRTNALNGTMFIGASTTSPSPPGTGGVSSIQNKLSRTSTNIPDSVNLYYSKLPLVGTATVIANNTAVSSFGGTFGNTTLGSYNGYTNIWAANANLPLTTLATAPIAMTVWQFGPGNMASPFTGIKILDLTTNADGSTTINPPVGKADQAAVSVTAPASATYRQSGLTATAAGGDGSGAYSYSAGASDACTVNATTGAITVTSGIGTCAITATRAGDSSYNDSAASAAATVTVGKAPLAVTADSTSRAFGAANPTFTASYSGFVNGEILATSGIIGAPALASSANATTPVGTAPITAAIGTLASSNYSFSFVNGTLTITGAAQTTPVVVTVPANATYRQTGLVATASGGDGSGAYSYDAGISTACTVNAASGALSITAGTGTCSITATRAADSNYSISAASAAKSVTIAKAVLTVTADNASRTYGTANPTFTATYSGFVNSETLATSGISGAPALVSSANATTPVGTAPITPAIGTLASSNYSFSFVNGVLTITGGAQTTPVVVTVPANATYRQTGLVTTASGGDGSGAYSYSAGTSDACTVNVATGEITITKGSGTCTITATRAADSNYSVSAASAAKTVAIGKAALTVTADNTSRAYGAANPTFTATYSGFVNSETLATSGISGAPALAGSATATTPVGTAPITAAIGTLASSNYSFSFVNGVLTITAAAQTTPVTVTAPASATYGQTSLVATASGGDGSGAYSYSAGTSDACTVNVATGTLTITSGSGTCTITATRAADSNYSVSAASAAKTVAIGKAALSVTANNLTKTVGTADPTLTYSVTGFVNGDTTAIITGSLTRVAGETAGTYTINQGTLAAGSNYTIAYTGALLTISDKIVPTITWPTPAAITYGTTLAAAQLNASAAVAGTFTYTPAAGSLLNAGSQTLSVTFTPTDAVTYASTSATVNLIVTKATPNVTTWPTAAAISFGQTLASATLTGGTASTAGSFAFTTPTTAPASGTAPQEVTFTPNDAANYIDVTGTINVTVNKSTLTVTAGNQTKIVGSSDPALTYTVTGFVNGDTTAIITGSLTRVAGETAGTYAINQGTLAAGSNYTIAYTGALLTISDKIVPTITWPTPTAITYGTTLAAAQLNASAAVAGTFTYTPAAGSLLNAGSQTLSVTFTPTDAVTYASTSATVNLIVTKATPNVTTWPTAAAISFGQTLASATLTGGTASTAGSFAFTTPTTAPASGTAPQEVTFTPSNAANYIDVTGSINVTVTVNKVTPVITWNTPAAINTVTPLSATQLNATANVPGSFVYSPAAGSLLPAGIQELTVTFTPNDPVIYNSQTATVNQTVNQAVDSWYPSGSLSGTGTPNIIDALRVFRSSLGLDTLSAAERKNIDVAPLVNGRPAPDGKVDIGDALVILKLVVGSVPAW